MTVLVLKKNSYYAQYRINGSSVRAKGLSLLRTCLKSIHRRIRNHYTENVTLAFAATRLYLDIFLWKASNSKHQNMQPFLV